MNAPKKWDGENPLEISIIELNPAEAFLWAQLKGSIPGMTLEQVAEMRQVETSFTKPQRIALAMDGVASFVERGIAAWTGSKDKEGNSEFVIYFKRFRITHPMMTLAEMKAIEHFKQQNKR